ncbi:methyl-accepting chemotaxis protein [Paenibacillus sp. y28]|uniref:methyl-accepting chemotaxis protein n=1 Tax=Paenibacillus sp. y28 TaxID=3129110 RepID=UPI0030177B45
MRLTIGKKLSAGFVSVLIMLVAMGVVSVYKMTEMGEQAQKVQTVWMPRAMLLGDIKAGLINIERLALKAAVTSNVQEKETIETAINTAIEELKAKQEQFAELITEEEEQQQYAQLLELEGQLAAGTDQLLAVDQNADLKSISTIAQKVQAPTASALEILNGLHEASGIHMGTAMDITMQLYESGKSFINRITVAAAVIALSVAFIIARIISRPIALMDKAARQIAGGDLTVKEIQIGNKDEIGSLAASFNEMTQRLRSLIRQVDASAEHVAASAEELTAGTEQVSRASEQIAMTIEQVASGAELQARTMTDNAIALNQISIGGQQIASNVESVALAVSHASTAAAEGNDTIQATVRQMNAMNETVNGLAQAVQGLGERSRGIGQIVDVITGIASQTKLLALNASIEAARVGEHGAGFVVVATEVRKLAEQSSQSAEQIAQLIAAIQAETTQTVQLMRAGTKEVAEGIRSVHQAGEAFGRIRESVGEVVAQIQEVSAASQQMGASTEQMAHSMNTVSATARSASAGMQNVSTSVEEQLASMQEISASAATLSKMSEDLRSVIGAFKL